MVILSKGAGAKRALLRRGGTPGETRTHYIPLRSMACRLVHRPLHNLPCCLIRNCIAWLLVNLHKNPCDAAS